MNLQPVTQSALVTTTTAPPDPEVRRRFESNKSLYKQLGDEVEHTIRTRLASEGIKFASFSSRVKEFDSFWEKITQRKQYADPFVDMTDFVGTRVVCLYNSDIDRIRDAIEQDFVMTDVSDKRIRPEEENDKFGYLALQFAVRFKDGISGPRYDPIKHLKCEVQLRTVLHDAWAIIQHHLAYKQGSDVPQVLRRKLFCLAAVMESADDAFEAIRVAREKYRSELTAEAKSDDDRFLSNEINLDSLRGFTEAKYPESQGLESKETLVPLMRCLEMAKIKKLSELQVVLNQTEVQLEAFLEKFADGAPVTAYTRMTIALSLKHPELAAAIIPGDPATWTRMIEPFLVSRPSLPPT